MKTLHRMITRVLGLTLACSLSIGGFVSMESTYAEQAAIQPETGLFTEEQPQGASEMKAGRRDMFKELAAFLNMDPAKLHKELNTNSLAQIAGQQGITRNALQLKVVELLKQRAAAKPAPLNGSQDLSATADKLIDRKGGWPAVKRRHAKPADLNGLAALLNLPPEKLKQELYSGKSLAELAQQQGISVDKVIDHQVKAVTMILDRHLTEGKLTKEQYEQRKARLRPFITELVHGKSFSPKLQYRSRNLS